MPRPPSPRSPLGSRSSKISRKIQKNSDFSTTSGGLSASSGGSAPVLLSHPGEKAPIPAPPPIIEPEIEVAPPANASKYAVNAPNLPVSAPTFNEPSSKPSGLVSVTDDSEITPLGYLLAVVRRAPPEGLTLEQTLFWEAKRLEAAKAAAPFVHGRQSVADGSPVGKTHEEQLAELD